MSRKYTNATLTILATQGSCSGRTIREALAAQGKSLSGPRFYELMAELEDRDLVHGWYKTVVVHEVEVPQRWFELTQDGLNLLAGKDP